MAPHQRGWGTLDSRSAVAERARNQNDRSADEYGRPSSVNIQTSVEPIPSVPEWFGEVALIAHTLTRLGLLAEISERVRFARKRFGTFEVIDFVVVLMGYAISGEPTLAAYYERLQPFATAFMALFGRQQLPHR